MGERAFLCKASLLYKLCFADVENSQYYLILYINSMVWYIQYDVYILSNVTYFPTGWWFADR